MIVPDRKLSVQLNAQVPLSYQPIDTIGCFVYKEFLVIFFSQKKLDLPECSYKQNQMVTLERKQDHLFVKEHQYLEPLKPLHSLVVL